MSLKEFIQKNRPKLTQHILTYLEGKKQQHVELSYHQDVLQRLIEFVPTGKMIRGLGVLLAYQVSTNKEPDEKMMNAAAAIELVHSALLIHDDIMDNDHTRRGHKTIFSQYVDNSFQAPNSLFYGQGMGFMAGDIGIFLGFDLLGKSSTDGITLQKLISIFSHFLHLTGIGQMHDFHFGQTSQEPTTEEISLIYKYKSAYYTFVLPFLMGSSLGNGSTELSQKLEQFGEKLGILFQVKDDEMGIFGTQEETGKPIGSDIRENKKTLIRSFLFEKSSIEEKTLLNTYFGNTNISDQQLDEIKNLFSKYKIREQIISDMEKTAQELIILLKDLPVEKEYKYIFEDLIYYNIKRKT